MPVSRYNYIHRNKSNITIGIKGEVKSVFKIEDLIKQVETVQQQSVRLSLDYSGNAKFPAFLGMDKEYTKILDDIPYRISDVLSRRGNYQPESLLSDLRRVKKLGTSEEEFKKAFYNEVNKYYGTSFTPKETERLLKSKTFMYVPADRYAYRNRMSDPIPLQDWIIENSDLDERDVRHINDISELQRIAQTYRQNRELGR